MDGTMKQQHILCLWRKRVISPVEICSMLLLGCRNLCRIEVLMTRPTIHIFHHQLITVHLLFSLLPQGQTSNCQIENNLLPMRHSKEIQGLKVKRYYLTCWLNFVYLKFLLLNNYSKIENPMPFIPHPASSVCALNQEAYLMIIRKHSFR